MLILHWFLHCILIGLAFIICLPLYFMVYHNHMSSILTVLQMIHCLGGVGQNITHHSCLSSGVVSNCGSSWGHRMKDVSNVYSELNSYSGYFLILLSFFSLSLFLLKMYAEALHENERLKSRLHDSKQELVKIRAQLEKVTQVQRHAIHPPPVTPRSWLITQQYLQSFQDFLLCFTITTQFSISRGTTGYQRGLQCLNRRKG